MLRVLVAQHGVVCRYAPVYAETAVKDAYAPVCLRMVELVTLVLEHRRFAQHGKAMRKPFGDKKLEVVVLG